MATYTGYTPPQTIFGVDFYHTLQQILHRPQVIIKCGDRKVKIALAEGVRSALLHVVSFSNTTLSLDQKAKSISQIANILATPGAILVTDVSESAASASTQPVVASPSSAVVSPVAPPVVTTSQGSVSEAKTRPAQEAPASKPKTELFTCSTSKEPFSTAAELREFMKTPLHVFNLKRLQAGDEIVSKEEFELAQDNPEFMELLQVRSFARQSSEAQVTLDDFDDDRTASQKTAKGKKAGVSKKKLKSKTGARKERGKYEYSDEGEEDEDAPETDETPKSASKKSKSKLKSKTSSRVAFAEDSGDDDAELEQKTSQELTQQSSGVNESYPDNDDDDEDNSDDDPEETLSYSEAESVLDYDDFDTDYEDDTDRRSKGRSRSRSRSHSRARSDTSETPREAEDTIPSAMFSSPVITIECPALSQEAVEEFKRHLLKTFLGVETIEEARALAGLTQPTDDTPLQNEASQAQVDGETPEAKSDTSTKRPRTRRPKMTADEKKAYNTLVQLDTFPDLTGPFSATLYRPLLLGPRVPVPSTASEGLRLMFQLASLPMLQPPTHFSVPRQRWAIFLSMGGKFSGAIFEGTVCAVHRTFQNYTTRRKQGGSQKAFDSKNGNARSVGATIRRQQTVRFRERVHECLFEWRESLAHCHRVFLFAPGDNKNNFFVTAEEQARWLSTGGSSTAVRQVELLSTPMPLYQPADGSSIVGQSGLVHPEHIAPATIPLLSGIKDQLAQESADKFSPFTATDVWTELHGIQFSHHTNVALHPLWSQANLASQYLYLFRRDDPRLRGIPFSVRKINHEEVRRVHSELTGCVIDKTAPSFEAEAQEAASSAESELGQDAKRATEGKFGRSRNLAKFLRQNAPAPQSADEFYSGWIRPILCAALKARDKQVRLDLLDRISEWYANVLDNYDEAESPDAVDHIQLVKTFLEENSILLSAQLNIQSGRLPSAIVAPSSDDKQSFHANEAAVRPLFVAAAAMLDRVDEEVRKALARSHLQAIERAKIQKSKRKNKSTAQQGDSDASDDESEKVRAGDITSSVQIGQILSKTGIRDGSKLSTYARLNESMTAFKSLESKIDAIFGSGSENSAASTEAQIPEASSEEEVDVSAEWSHLLYVLTSRFPEDINASLPSAYAGRTLLHWLCNEQATEDILYPLLDAGADPSLVDEHGNVPAELAQEDSECLRALEFYAGEHMDAYAWLEDCAVQPYDAEAERLKLLRTKEQKARAESLKQAEVARKAQLKKEKEQQREEAELKARQAQAERKEQLEKERQRNAEIKEAEKARLQKLYGMTEKDKRREENQRRANAFRELAGLGKAKRCDKCNEPLLSMPFERLSYQYCSTKCLRDHRDELGE